jgi:predicted AAA+ superfamily ATPase
MYPRQAHDTLLRLARGFSVLALTGPRQSGKTTLARSAFPQKPYVSLENPDEMGFAGSDPKRFLARFPEGAILDEVQRCPQLLSWLQGIVDERQVMGQFILTGSAQFDLIAGMSQSLAGRIGRVELLPMSVPEMVQGGCLPDSLDGLLLNGGYPAIYQRALAASDWFPNYVATYLERDVRQIIAVRDLSQFQRFVRMCAARSGQLLSLAGLGADCGISAVTARLNHTPQLPLPRLNPSFASSFSGGQKPVKPLCSRLRPTKAVKARNHSDTKTGLPCQPSASESRTKKPAMMRIMRSMVMDVPF